MEDLRPTHAGGIVIGEDALAVVHNEATGTWTFPKGSIEAGETDEEAARREVEEETGLRDLKLIDDLGAYTRSHGGVDGGPTKIIHYFLFSAPIGASIAPANEISEAVWVPLAEAAEKITIAKDREWFASVYDRVHQAVEGR